MSDDPKHPPLGGESTAAEPQRFSTDEIIEVYEHLKKRNESWMQIWAEQGMVPSHVERAVAAIWSPMEDGKAIRAAGEAFALGLQFGAMALAPIPYDPKEDDNCECLFCQMRRSMEAQAEAEAEGGDQGGGEEV